MLVSLIGLFLILVAIESTDLMLFGNLPLSAHSVSHLIQAPVVVQLHAGERCDFAFANIVFHLQAASEYMTVLAAHICVFPPTVVEVIARGGLLRTIGVLPSLSQGDVEAVELQRTCQISVEAMSGAPVRRSPVVVGAILVVGYLFAIVIIDELITCP